MRAVLALCLAVTLLPGSADSAAARLHLKFGGQVRAGVPSTLIVQVMAGKRPVRGALVVLDARGAGGPVRRQKVGRRGRAVFRNLVLRAGTIRASASRSGYHGTRRSLTVLAPPATPTATSTPTPTTTSTPTPSPTPTATPTPSPTPTPTAPPLPPPPAVNPDPVLVAAGDISCAPGNTADCDASGTADLVLSQSPSAVLAVGDLQYESGTLDEFEAEYDHNWGRFKDITYPVPGNHEYQDGNANGYFAYWGLRAAPPSGYYSFDLGSWHIIALNSSCQGGCGAGSAQEEWLRADLATHPARCTLAFWHQPRFSSGIVGNEPQYDAFWRDLYSAGADVVVSAHDHDYERVGPVDPDGSPDHGHGIQEFVVGTGGADLTSFGTVLSTSRARFDVHGVLRMVLHPTGYDWEFLAVGQSSPLDSGHEDCH